jgi:two-component system sensor histidine kinase AlgZ
VGPSRPLAARSDRSCDPAAIASWRRSTLLSVHRYFDALRGLTEPRRFAALAAVFVAVVATEALASRAWLEVGLDVLLFATFVLVAPGSFRVLAPRGALGLFAYGVLGVACVGAVAWLVAQLSPMWTYMIGPGSLAVLVALFLVGGWGLGRDIDLTERAGLLALEAERRALEAQRAQIEAQRAALVAEQNALLAQRAQLDPHFLFNVLNAIAEHCRHDPEIAERSLLALASLLRTMLDATRAPSWPLHTELELVRAVTDLYAMRDHSRYRFRLAWPTLEGVTIPPLLLLPVIENAVTHGPGAEHDGEVTLEVTRAGGRVSIRVENPGPFTGPREGGEGLSMIRKRLGLEFGDAASFSIASVSSEGRAPRTRVTISLPTHATSEAT